MTDLTIEHLIHMNDNYQVVFIPKDNRTKKENHEGVLISPNFEVRHRQWDTVEYFTEALPVALSIAEHWNKILVTRAYMDDSGIMSIEGPLQNPGEDSGGVLQ